jgi:hypothetical protein
MDDEIELFAMYRQLEAGGSSPQAPWGAAATRSIRPRQSERRSEAYADKKMVAAECAYDTLDTGFIRLVKITRNALTGFIECRTEQFSLQHPPTYTALSYACGSRPANFNLKLNGRDWFVRKNLSRFLRQHLQMDRDSQEWLWIDAICIDQANLSERTHQVRLMADIYGKASRVVAWLGPAYEQSDDAMRGLLRSQCDERILETVPWILALVGLCSRRYWHRLWVLQELKLAKQKDLMCGSKVISWQHFERFMLRVSGSSDEVSPSTPSSRALYIYNSAAMRMIRLTWTPPGTSLLDLMDMSVHLQCEETRDRVFALCGLATTEAASIDPDYETDIPVLLNTIFRHHIEQIPEISIPAVVSTCEKLESMFGTQPGTMFELHDSMNHLPGPGLVYQRICTRSIATPGMTLLWAIHYEHIRVQQLIKMAHCLQSPFIPVLCCLEFVFSMVVWSFLPKSEDAFILFIIAIVTINTATFAFQVEYYRASRLPELDGCFSRHNEWRRRSAWFFDTVLEHRSDWICLWWVSFIISEGSIYIADPACRPLKRWFLDLRSRLQRKLGAKTVSLE